MLAIESLPETATKSHLGLSGLTCMTFGLKNASETFQTEIGVIDTTVECQWPFLSLKTTASVFTFAGGPERICLLRINIIIWWMGITQTENVQWFHAIFRDYSSELKGLTTWHYSQMSWRYHHFLVFQITFPNSIESSENCISFHQRK